MDAFVQTYGLWAVFVGCLFEGETFALAGGVAAHRGLLPLPSVILAAFCGSVLTDQALFWIARTHRARISGTRLAQSAGFGRATRLIERYPNFFILIFRFVYGIRLASPLAIGMSGASGGRYFVLNVVAAAIWASVITFLGYLFSQGIEAVIGRMQAVEQVVGLVLVCAIVLLLAARRWMKGRWH